MRAFRILALTGLAFLLCLFMAACGGGSTPAPPPSPPVITTTAPPQGSVNIPYSFFIQATGGTGIYSWAITVGSLPPGLSFNTQTAAITGTPTVFGSYTFTVQVTDAKGVTGSSPITLVIGGVVVVQCDSCFAGTFSLPYGNPGVAYSAMLSVTGGQSQPPYTWCVVESNNNCDNGSGGALPPGLTIATDSNGNGIISGTPTTPGTPSTFTVQASDSEMIPTRGSAQLTLTIIAIGTTSLPNGTINAPYAQSLFVLGGTGPYTWNITQGSLPPGLSLHNCTASRLPQCQITGTPTQLGTSTFTAQVTDGESPPAKATSVSLSIIVQGPKLSITTVNLPNATVGVPYSGVLQADGGIPPLTWCIVESGGGCDNGAATLPAGLTLNTSTGVISGTPTASGTTSFVAQVQDTEDPPQITQSPTLSINVNPGVTNATLTGHYAFSFNGYNNGNPVLMAGAFVTDGNGNITSGFLDRNDGSGEPIDNNSHRVTPETIGTGSVYALSANGIGHHDDRYGQGNVRFLGGGFGYGVRGQRVAVHLRQAHPKRHPAVRLRRPEGAGPRLLPAR